MKLHGELAAGRRELGLTTRTLKGREKASCLFFCIGSEGSV